MIKITGKNRDKYYNLTVETTYNSLQEVAKKELYDELDDGEFYQNEDDEIVYPYSNSISIDAEIKDEKSFFNLFGNCEAEHITFKSIDISYTTDMGSMFQNCKHLKSLDLSSFDTGNVTDMSNMFYSCTYLKHLNLSNFDTSNVMDMFGMLDWCFELITLDISSFDFSKVRNTAVMFENCSSLTDLKFGKNLKVSLSLRNCPLTHESALSVINGLAKVKGQQSVSFSEETYDMLTAEDIKKAEDKNWEVK